MLPQIQRLINDLRQIDESEHRCSKANPMRVLIVEDDLNDALLMQMALENAGCLVDVAMNGRKAIDIIKSDPDKYCVMFLDIGLPQVDGISVLIETRKVTRSIHVVIVTGGDRLNEIPEDSYFAVIRKPLGDILAVEIVQKTSKMTRDAG